MEYLLHWVCPEDRDRLSIEYKARKRNCSQSGHWEFLRYGKCTGCRWIHRSRLCILQVTAKHQFSIGCFTSIYDLPRPSANAPYNNTVTAYDRDLKLPYTLDWNLSIEQSLVHRAHSHSDTVASAGRRLLEGYFQDPEAVNPAFSEGDGVDIITNGSWSNYNSLQAQFQQHLAHGLQVLASETWSHSIDNLSNNFISYQPLLKGNSDFDVRQNFQAAMTYAAPTMKGTPMLIGALTKDWAVDLRDSFRTAEPVDIYGDLYYASNGVQYYSRPNVVPGEPFYVYGSRDVIPGGKEININAFTSVSGAVGDAPRNFLRGFGANEIDLALRREFGLTQRLRYSRRSIQSSERSQFRSGLQHDRLRPRPALQAYKTLNESLKDQSSLYAQGGPRSLQLALKILF